LKKKEAVMCGNADLSQEVMQQIEIQKKYSGYIDRQMRQIEKFRALEKIRLSEDLDFLSMNGLSREAQQKLHKMRPASVGHASRIAGISPADISVLIIQLETMRRRGLNKNTLMI
jgi:tRNA uridine 5-carboxymethylaminomethyl modification enzyme